MRIPNSRTAVTACMPSLHAPHAASTSAIAENAPVATSETAPATASPRALRSAELPRIRSHSGPGQLERKSAQTDNVSWYEREVGVPLIEIASRHKTLSRVRLQVDLRSANLVEVARHDELLWFRASDDRFAFSRPLTISA